MEIFRKIKEEVFYRRNWEDLLVEEDCSHIFSFHIDLLLDYNRYSTMSRNHRQELIVVVEDNNDSTVFHSLSFYKCWNDQRNSTRIHDEDSCAFRFQSHWITWEDSHVEMGEEEACHLREKERKNNENLVVN